MFIRAFLLAVLSFAFNLAATATVAPSPAYAQFGLDRAFKKALRLPRIDGGGRSERRRSRGSDDKSSSSDDDSDSSSTSDSKTSDKDVKKEIDRLEKARLLRTAVATQAEQEEQGRSALIERQRNVDQAVQDFISCLKGLHGFKPAGGTRWLCKPDNSDTASKNKDVSQVTAGEILRAIDEAYRGAHLTDFERLAGELWTRERLLVRIVDRSVKELPPYFRGVGAKGPSMDELKKVFATAANDVYARALEISEVVGISNGFDRFIRTAYERSGDTNAVLGPGRLQGIDGRFERVANTALTDFSRNTPVEQASGESNSDALGLDRQFQFRFRARRLYYECLTATLMLPTPEVRSIEASHTGTAGGRTVAGAAIETGASAPELDEVAWIETRKTINQKCDFTLRRAAKEAEQRKIYPQSARWTGEIGDLQSDREPDHVGDDQPGPTPLTTKQMNSSQDSKH